MGRCIRFFPSLSVFLCLFVVLLIDGSSGGLVFTMVVLRVLSSPPVFLGKKKFLGSCKYVVS